MAAMGKVCAARTGFLLTPSVRRFLWIGEEEQIWNKRGLQGLNAPAHSEESFSYRHQEPNGSVLSPDGANYVLTG